jgi:hypothetical protein
MVTQIHANFTRDGCLAIAEDYLTHSTEVFYWNDKEKKCTLTTHVVMNYQRGLMLMTTDFCHQLLIDLLKWQEEHLTDYHSL